MMACSLTSLTTFRRKLPPSSRHVSHAVYLIMETEGYSETSRLYHIAQRHIPEEGCSGIGHSILPDPHLPPTEFRQVVVSFFMWQATVKVKVKVKVKIEKATKAQRGAEVYLYSFFNLGVRWGGWSTPSHGRFTPGERPGTHGIGGWVDPRAGLDGCGKSRLHRDSIPGLSSP